MKKHNHHKVIAVIPARMGSSRFPGKPLAKILELPMIEHVRRRISFAKAIDEVYVATCDREIKQMVESFGGKAVMTSSNHQRCTDRVEEAIQKLPADIVIIVQGDEPLIVPALTEKLLHPFKNDRDIQCVNLLSSIHDDADLADPDIVKTILDIRHNVMYFSRASVPFRRARGSAPVYRQTGISVFRKTFLKKFSQLAPTPLEIVESIDFLRILEHQYVIRGVIYNQKTFGVDRPDDVEIIESILRTDPLQKKIYQMTLKN